MRNEPLVVLKTRKTIKIRKTRSPIELKNVVHVEKNLPVRAD